MTPARAARIAPATLAVLGVLGVLAALILVSVTGAPASARTAPGSAGVRIEDTFPLDDGWRTDSDTDVEGPTRHTAGIDLDPLCGLGAWPGDTRDRLTVSRTGPEMYQVRELSAYPSRSRARAVLRRIRDTVADCTRWSGGRGDPATLLSGYGTSRGPSGSTVVSFAVTQPDGRPGGAVFAFVRLGRAVLGLQDSGEWTATSAARGARQLVHHARAVIAAMKAFRPHTR